MAGMYDRIGDGDNVSINLLKAALVAVESGWITPAQAEAGLNAQIVAPLDAAAVADLVAIKDVLDGKTNVQKSLYMHQIDSIASILEVNPSAFTDAEFRTHLGI